MNYKYHIGISYASEQKEYVRKLQKSLEKFGINCFVDYLEPERLWGEYVPEKLRKIYIEECKLILVCLSKEYTEKDYTIFEGRLACERSLSGNTFLILKIDDVDLPWLNKTYGYLDAAKYPTDKIAEFIKKKYLVPPQR